MAKHIPWTTFKRLAAVIAAISLILLMLPWASIVSVMPGLGGLGHDAEGWFVLGCCVALGLSAMVLWRQFASLKLTVLLLGLGLFLVFAGTLVQTRLGIWEVIDTWFRGRVVWIHWELFPNIFNKASYNKPLDGWSFPFPGGFMILGLLSLNMLAAMAAKITSDWTSSARRVLLRRHAGIYILHVGLLIMFAGEFVTGLYAQEGRLSIKVGQWSDFVEDHLDVELAFIDPSGSETDRHVVIPQALLQRHAVVGGNGQKMTHPDLPVDLRIDAFMSNTEMSIQDQPSGFRGVAQQVKVIEAPPVPGTETQRADVPGVYVTLFDKKDGRKLGTWLCLAGVHLGKLVADPSPVILPQAIGQDALQIELRYARRYLGYRVYLDKVEHDKYDGTEIPHNYSSDVRIKDPKVTGERKSHIWMNHPLRYDGKAFYQQQMNAGQGLTGLQVVTNPGVWLPYMSCAVVTLGLLVQFGMSLLSYTRRSVR